MDAHDRPSTRDRARTPANRNRTRSRPRNHAVALFVFGCCALLASAAAAASPPPAATVAEAVLHEGEHRLRARLLVHPDDRVANGQLRVGVLFELAPGWHIYARDPGDSGMPTVLSWRLDGAVVGPTLWPPHQVFEESDGLFTTNGYSREVLLASLARFDDPARAGDVVHVDVDALACLVECVPVKFTLRGQTAFAGTVEAARSARERFDRDAGGLAADGAGAGRSLLALLGLALLGGLVLNAMPCVLPVLAIKLFGLAELAERDRREVALNALAYALGVTATMLVLAGVVAGLRAAGTAVGWGFQFQEPVFVAAVSTVVVLFALNLFGVYELRFNPGGLANLGNDAAGPRRSFFEGLLVVVLATPCSAPFLGTAVGFAFASSTAVIFAVFAAIGVGLAAPYLLVALSPGWARRMPRAGGWMLRLRSGLGFLLLATTAWLLWVFGRSVGSDGMAALLALLLAVAFAVWVHGALQQLGRTRSALAAGLATLALAATGLAAIHTTFDGSARGPVADQRQSAWQPFDPAAVASSLAAGHSVFVAFTADWCITCKLNEHNVLADERVVAAFEQHDIARFEADWTRRDETIRRELEKFGRAGVPMYLVYHPDAPQQPAQLPELLRVDDVIEALSRPHEPARVIQDTRSAHQASM